MAYTDKNINERLFNGLAGDPAEKAVQRYFTTLGLPLEPFGANRSDSKLFFSLPKILQIRPDFIGYGWFVEAQGYGKEGVITIKVDKLEWLKKWEHLMPVKFAFYSMSDNLIHVTTLAAITDICNSSNVEQVTLDKGTRGEKLAWRVPASLVKDDTPSEGLQ